MLNFLACRQTGCHHPRAISNAEVTRRCFSLELSKFRDVEQNHAGGINSLDVDPVEGRYMLSGGADGKLAIHDLENLTGEPKCSHKCVCTVGHGHKHAHKKGVETVSWYPFDTGMFLSSGSDQVLKIWDTNTLVMVDSYGFSDIVSCHTMSPVAVNHSLVAVANYSSQTKLVDLRTGSAIQILKGHRLPVVCCDWSTRDPFVLATGSQDNKCMLWDVRSAKGALMVLDQYNGGDYGGGSTALANTAHSGHVNGLSFTDDGLFLVTFGTDNRIRLWNTTTGKNTLVNYGHLDNDKWKRVKFAISSGANPELLFVPNGNDIHILDLFQGSQIDILKGHYKPVNACVFHPFNQELYSIANDRNILIWTPDVETEKAYDEYVKLMSQKAGKEDAKDGAIQNLATMDDWSSDED